MWQAQLLPMQIDCQIANANEMERKKHEQSPFSHQKIGRSALMRDSFANRPKRCTRAWQRQNNERCVAT